MKWATTSKVYWQTGSTLPATKNYGITKSKNSSDLVWTSQNLDLLPTTETTMTPPLPLSHPLADNAVKETTLQIPSEKPLMYLDYRQMPQKEKSESDSGNSPENTTLINTNNAKQECQTKKLLNISNGQTMPKESSSTTCAATHQLNMFFNT